jgi:hypothetical protein
MVLLIAAVVPHLDAQVLELNGGSSSLYQAQGGTLSARGSSYDASLGAGIVAGKFVGGANFTKMAGRYKFIVGDDYVRFELPTDIFDSSHYLIALGAGVKTKVLDTDIFAFGGATSSDFSSPFFEGVRAESPAGMLFLTKQILPDLQVSSKMVFSHQTTAIQSLEWVPADKLRIGVSGGVGANQPYGAASFDFQRPWIDLKSAYIEAGSLFRRVAVEMPLLSEPDRENVEVTVRPSRYLSFSGGRQNFLSPLGNSQSSVQSTVNQVSAATRLAGTDFSASLYHSTYLGNSNNATAYTADRGFFSRVHATTSYLESRPNDGPKTQAFISTFEEILSPRLNVIELVNRSQGQTTVSFGGGLLSNLASITAEYQTYYVPERNASPFEQALILDVQVHLFHGLTLHGATFVAPDGSLRYTADTQAMLARQGMFSPSDGAGTVAREDIGSFLLRGSVVDPNGRSVPGAALMIDQLLIYTNDNGEFFIRERKPHTHVLKVLGDQFLSGDSYKVVSAPSTVRSCGGSSEPPTVIVVQRMGQTVRSSGIAE